MREIKFRGKSTYSGRIIYGDLLHFGDRTHIGNIRDYETVYPESVAQLVGYDEDGNEVYDDDILIDEDNEEWDDFVDVFGAYSLGERFYGYKLKKPDSIE